MKEYINQILLSIILITVLAGCGNQSSEEVPEKTDDKQEKAEAPPSPAEELLAKYVEVSLTTDLSKLSENEKKMIPVLIEAAKTMDAIFWQEAYGDKKALLADIEDEALRKFAIINYGPWDRLDGNEPFLVDVGPKSAGANFYPQDMTKAEFESAKLEDKKSQYTLIRWDQNFMLTDIPYHAAFDHEVDKAAELLNKAAELAEDEGFKKYLKLRAEALLTDKYNESDIAWLDMKDNTLDLIIGPIENYEDQLYGYKSAHEAYVLVKDKEWSKRLERYVSFLPELQESLPVEDKYKTEKPGLEAQLNAYDVIYYAGDCNAGSKTIAINLPNDENIQKEKGTRRLQLKNVMRSKFDKILVPISNVLIAEDQRKHVTFDAFFGNTMFHEVAHGLGVKNTINGKGTVREALKEQASALEEGKADILGIYMITKLFEKGEIKEGDIKDYYVTFMASIFRSIRFGASSAHGRANLLRFNYFQKHGAFEKDKNTDTYRVNFDKMREAISSLSALILTLQGNGDYEGVHKLMAEKGGMKITLQSDLARLLDEGIPVDLIFNQGTEVLGLPAYTE